MTRPPIFSYRSAILPYRVKIAMPHRKDCRTGYAAKPYWRIAWEKQATDSSDWMADLVDGRRIALHEADVDAGTVRGRERRHFEEISELRGDAATDDAGPKSAPRGRPGLVDFRVC